MSELHELFPTTYEASRARFRNHLSTVQSMWPKADLFQHVLPGDEDLTIDWIYSEALESNERVLLFTTGEHGVEGYVGSAMLQRFIEVYTPRLNPRNTGILLLHAINPWGMKHHRRGIGFCFTDYLFGGLLRFTQQTATQPHPPSHERPE